MPLFDIIPTSPEIGSRICIVKDWNDNHLYVGMTGTIVTTLFPTGTLPVVWGVELDSLTEDQIASGILGHSLNNILPRNNGQWVGEDGVEVI